MKSTLTLIISIVFLAGCASRYGTQTIVQKSQPVVKAPIQQRKLPPAPKKKIQLKEVDDNNYSDKYMYPEDTAAAKKDPITEKKPTISTLASSTMSKEECITMISPEKFDKYTTMFGSEAASIKRCAMLKAMNK